MEKEIGWVADDQPIIAGEVGVESIETEQKDGCEHQTFLHALDPVMDEALLTASGPRVTSDNDLPLSNAAFN
ncbi:hypothetical protein scyTo_0005031 [Scyliorhinus torazame]|uniref:Uncharacterized protein n=1 Tax=Scyliorhinus torazame TaxID=75743 RepID=A0A401P0Y0_SCYTO|nr:hypothetical protein [Scyliorhinus torazame]